MLTIDLATPWDAQDLAASLNAADAAELQAAGMTVAQCMEGVQAQALRWDGVLVALFGAQSHPQQPRGAVPWMLCTEALAKVPRRAMADISRAVVQAWMADHDTLSNLIHRHNKRAIRFVQWLGFKVSDLPCGPGQQFYVFEWRRPHV